MRKFKHRLHSQDTFSTPKNLQQKAPKISKHTFSVGKLVYFMNTAVSYPVGIKDLRATTVEQFPMHQ